MSLCKLTVDGRTPSGLVVPNRRFKKLLMKECYRDLWLDLILLQRPLFCMSGSSKPNVDIVGCGNG